VLSLKLCIQYFYRQGSILSQRRNIFILDTELLQTTQSVPKTFEIIGEWKLDYRKTDVGYVFNTSNVSGSFVIKIDISIN